MNLLFRTILLSMFAFSSTQANQPIVHLIKLDGAINPATSDYIHSAIQQADGAGAQCLIIQLNTPGGLLKSTRVIVSDLLESRIPVVVYVAPGGSQAASAGVFVTMAAHIAAMAPGTNIGAAHPVTLEGKEDSIMMEKSTNDAAAFIRTISEKRHRNIRWAEDAVRKSLSITESEALKEHVIDLVAVNLNELLAKIDSMKIRTTDGEKIIATKDARVVTIDMTFSQKILALLSDPNIAYILFMLGVYGLLFELYNPGSIFPGVVGVISLILAFYSLHTLPVNYAGVGLILFAVILFILEIKIVSHGLLAIGGTISLLLGSIMLINTGSTLEFVAISWSVIISVVVTTLLFFLFVIGMGLKAQRRKRTTGAEGLIGEVGETLSNLDPKGEVRVHGEIWSAESIEGRIVRGTKVAVVEMKDLTIKVKKIEP